MMEHKLKVLYITNIPSPYRVEFFNELGCFCDLTVLFERSNASDREDAWISGENSVFKRVLLKGVLSGNDGSISFGAIKHLAKYNYDIIIVGGYSTPTAMLTILYMKIKGVPFLLNADGGFVKGERKFVKKIKNFFIGSATGYLSTGNETNKYLEYYGAKKENIYCYPFSSIKKDLILMQALTPEERTALKNAHTITCDKMIVSVGQFIHRKGFDVLIRAMQRISDAALYIIGGNPIEEYKQLLKDNNINNVFFLPFMKQEELFQYYKMADVFVLPTREDIWGLVINEAMSQGLPIITTDKCVAGIELVQNGKNGFLVPVESVEALSEKISIVLQEQGLRRNMSEESLKIIRNYSIEEMAQRHMEIFNLYRGVE